MKETGTRKKKKEDRSTKDDSSHAYCVPYLGLYLYAIGNVGSSTCGIPMN